MKKLFALKVLFVVFIFFSSSFCQQDINDKRIIQLATGKDKMTFVVLDYQNDEPLIGAAIYSFSQKKILATTNLYGIAITDKEQDGNIEVSYIAYYSVCFKLDNKHVDSVLIWMNPEPLNFGDGVVSLDTNNISPSEKGRINAEQDLVQNKIQLLTKNEPTTEQSLFAKNHNFEFIVWMGNESYREVYNEIVIDFLNNKFDINIEEELRAICWRNYQP